MMRTALVALLVGAVLTACGIRIVKYEFADDQVVADKFTSVRVRTGSGDVSIRYQQGLTETKIHRKIQHAKDNKPANVSHRIEGNALVLEDCGRNCSIDYEVAVPDPAILVRGEEVGSGNAVIEGLASVDYQVGSGNVTVRDIAGDVKIRTGSGDFRATAVKGTVTANVGSGNLWLDQLKGKVLVNTHSGDIRGTAMDADVTADADSGNIDLTFLSARTARIDTRSGDVTVRVPGNDSYKVGGDTSSGERRIDVRTDPNALNELKLTTRSGDVKVLGV
ncbi:DUF4097 family beta strand repeat-containing protein [Lentzea sp. NPDC051213]|uniref:DUF4097 family beta strand repeat-containing protein n=1 Tax=Lentzea sp. NPDC051213 TaxID=3364126 RepID=UPI0037A4BB28